MLQDNQFFSKLCKCKNICFNINIETTWSRAGQQNKKKYELS